MSDDLYDFSGVTFDLQLLKSELKSLQATTNRHIGLYNQSQQQKIAKVEEEEEEEEEWFPPTPPVYDVTEKLIEVNRIFHEDPSSTVYEPNRLRWRPGSGLVEVKWIYKNDNEPEADKRNGEKKTFVFLAGNESEILSPSPQNGAKENLDSFSSHVNEVGPPTSKKSVTLLPQLLPPKDDSKPPILSQKSKVKRDESTRNEDFLAKVSAVSNCHSISESPTPARTRLSAENGKLIFRHKSSDLILESPSLPPVSRRRHSSQDRLGHFSAKTSAAEGNKPVKTTTINTQISLPPRPKISKTQILDHSKLKYTRSFSGPIQATSNVFKRDQLDETSKSEPDNSKNIYKEKGPKTTVQPYKKRITSKESPLVKMGTRCRTIQRTASYNNSYNSTSSNSSICSQATEDTSTSSSESAFAKIVLNKAPTVINHPRITADVLMTNSEDAHTLWKQRKREEKRLSERRTFLQSQMRRLS